MGARNPFKDIYVYDFWLPVDVFKGYVLSDMKPAKFEELARGHIARKYDVLIDQIASLAGREKGPDGKDCLALPMRWAGVIDFKDFSDQVANEYRPELIFGKYAAYEIFVDEKEGEKMDFLNFRGLMVTDCPEPEFRRLMQGYQKTHASRSRSNMLAHIRAEGHFARWLNYHPVIMIDDQRLMHLKKDKTA